MSEVFSLGAVLFAGLLLGTFFFGGLLWTVGKGLSAAHPAVWFFGSRLVRFAVVLGVFYMVSAGRWERLVICGAGFLIARVVLIRLAGRSIKPSGTGQGVGDAS